MMPREKYSTLEHLRIERHPLRATPAFHGPQGFIFKAPLDAFKGKRGWLSVSFSSLFTSGEKSVDNNIQ